MTIWRTQFERFNAGFDPLLKQTADVVFETDIILKENIKEFHDVARKAMWEQNPHWKDSSFPLEGYSDWSPVMCSFEYTEV